MFDDAPVDQAVEGIVNGIFFNQGHVCCAGSRLLVQESVAEPVLDRLRRRVADAAARRPAGQEHRHRRDQLREQLDKIRELSDSGEPEGAERWSPPCELPERGFWFPPTIFTGVSQSHRIAREEIFGPVLSVLTFRTPEEAVAKANNTPVRAVRGHLDRQGQPDPVAVPAAAGRRGLGQHVQQVRPREPVRRLPGVWIRTGGRPARAGRVPRCLTSGLAVRKTYKLFIGGAFPRSESGRSYPVHGRCRAARPAAGLRRAGLAQGRAGRGQGGPRRVRRLVRRHRLQPRPGPVPGRRDAGGPGGPVRRRGGRGRGREPGRRARPRSARPSTAGSGTRAGPTRWPRWPARRTRWPART